MRRFANSARLLLAAAAFGALGCGDDSTTTEPQPFAVRFAAMAAGVPAGCTTEVAGLGPVGDRSIGLSDLRFYVSNLQLFDASGVKLEVTLDQDEFQYTSSAGSVVLVDLTGNVEGSCSGTAATAAEGTARTHEAITGLARGGAVTSIAFDVGVPQSLMRDTISAYSPEGAPSPLNEMYWNWASGYRHLVMNFTVHGADASPSGEGYLHIGSRNCGPEDGLALEDREACEHLNTPAVSLDDIDLANDAVSLDVVRLLEGLDFVAPVYDTETFEVIGEGPGVECHSAPSQPDCLDVFGNLGIDMASGAADSTQNAAFLVAR